MFARLCSVFHPTCIFGYSLFCLQRRTVSDALKVLRSLSKQEENFAYTNISTVTIKLINENEVLQLQLSKFSLKNSFDDGNKMCAIGGAVR